MHNELFRESYKAVISLPPRRDNETEILSHFDFTGGVLSFKGQQFLFPDGFHAEALCHWLEDDVLILELDIHAEIVGECSRCLKPANLEISEKLMYLYYSHSAEGLDELDDYMPVEVNNFGRVLDIMPQIEESIYTLLPAKMLCRDDCKGLCPECGADLNEVTCSCKKENIDPRLEALKNFAIE
ncbi:MAG: DUF177 domain-containing protein [Synergistaceae bacterium]|nr:DUF177 domain-containing protein [Synergistaceae bacterium]